jgi:hypothetical protein
MIGTAQNKDIPFWEELQPEPPHRFHIQVQIRCQFPRRKAASHPSPVNLRTDGGTGLVHRHQIEPARSENSDRQLTYT